MSDFKELFSCDVKRYGERGPHGWTKKYLYYYRKASTCSSKLMNYWYRYMFACVSRKHGMEISRKTKIGRGLYIGHPYNITINEAAIIGENLTIHKGATIGQENRGKRKGAPTIGNRVWVGINSTIVGRISIGDDVLIAPNSYVNCDIPSHSIALGCPCKIIPRNNATENYVNNIV